MKLKRQDISSWAKTAQIIYDDVPLDVVLFALQLELKYYRRAYNIRRLKGRAGAMYRQQLLNSSLKGIELSELKNLHLILANATTARVAIKLQNLGLQEMYSLLKSELVGENRASVKKAIIHKIIIEEANTGFKRIIKEDDDERV